MKKGRRRLSITPGESEVGGDDLPGEPDVSSFESVLDMTPEGLSATHDFLQLLGIVVGQIALLSVAANPLADPAPRVAAARALRDLKEAPETLAERLRSTQFDGLDTRDIHTIVEKIREGTNPQTALAEVAGAKQV